MLGFFFTVPQNHCCVIQRFGKFSRIATGGLKGKLPVFDSIRHMTEWGGVATKEGGKFIELSEQQTDTPKRIAHTKDNVELKADASIYWRIIDPRRAVYEVDVLPQSVADSALNALRSCIGQLQLDEILSERQRLNDNIVASLSDIAQKWGIQISRVEIQELETNDATSDAMRQQMEAERLRRAAVSKAEGEAEARIKNAESIRKATVLEADGRAKATRVLAEADAEYIKALSESLGAEQAAKVLMAQKMLDGYGVISEGSAHKVFIPNSVQAFVGEALS